MYRKREGGREGEEKIHFCVHAWLLCYVWVEMFSGELFKFQTSLGCILKTFPQLSVCISVCLPACMSIFVLV